MVKIPDCISGFKSYYDLWKEIFVINKIITFFFFKGKLNACWGDGNCTREATFLQLLLLYSLMHFVPIFILWQEQSWILFMFLPCWAQIYEVEYTEAVKSFYPKGLTDTYPRSICNLSRAIISSFRSSVGNNASSPSNSGWWQCSGASCL